MGDNPRKRALLNYRSRLSERGMTRFEVLGLEGDRELIRSLARRLAEDGPEAQGLRANVRKIAGTEGRKGGIVAVLRRSPLVGAELDLKRPREAGRKVDL